MISIGKRTDRNYALDTSVSEGRATEHGGLAIIIDQSWFEDRGSEHRKDNPECAGERGEGNNPSE